MLSILSLTAVLANKWTTRVTIAGINTFGAQIASAEHTVHNGITINVILFAYILFNDRHRASLQIKRWCCKQIKIRLTNCVFISNLHCHSLDLPY